MNQHPLITLVSVLVTCLAFAVVASPAAAQKKNGKAKSATGKATDREAIDAFATRRTKARNRPSNKGNKVFRVRRGARLLVIGRKGKKWLKVQNGDGLIGWVRSSAVETDEDSTESDDSTDLVDPNDPSIAEFDSAGPDRARLRLSERGLELAADAALGLSSYSRTFSSNGESALGGYRINAGTMAASASALARMHFGDLFAGARGSFSTNIGAPGIRFQDEEGELSEPNGFQVHQMGLGLEVGATLGESHPVRVAAGAGYALGYFVISKIQDNPGLIAREKLAGLRLGVSAATALSRDILVSAEFSWTPSASLAQTENLEDGMDSDVWSISGGAKASYLVDERHTLEAGYLGRRVKYKFTGQSTRQFDVTSARRKDIYHSFMVGASRSF